MFEVKKETIEKVLNYLATKPFMEVAGLIQELQQVKPVDEDKESKKK